MYCYFRNSLMSIFVAFQLHISFAHNYNIKYKLLFLVIENNDRRKSSTTSERLRAMVPWATQKAKSGLTKKMLYRRLPILTWLPKYNGQDAVGDLVAGITVGLTVIPQSLAYSNIAGLPPQVRIFIFYEIDKSPNSLQYPYGCYAL